MPTDRHEETNDVPDRRTTAGQKSRPPTSAVLQTVDRSSDSATEIVTEPGTPDHRGGIVFGPVRLLNVGGERALTRGERVVPKASLALRGRPGRTRRAAIRPSFPAAESVRGGKSKLPHGRTYRGTSRAEIGGFACVGHAFTPVRAESSILFGNCLAAAVGTNPSGLSLRSTPHRKPLSTGPMTSVAGARTSVSARCVLIRHQPSPGLPGTVSARTLSAPRVISKIRTLPPRVNAIYPRGKSVR